MKAMISQPMAGKTDEEIKETRERAIAFLEAQGYEVADTYFAEEFKSAKHIDGRSIPIYFLSKSLEAMSLCGTVYFCKGWETARGCKIEHDAAEAYGLHVIYEEVNYVKD